MSGQAAELAQRPRAPCRGRVPPLSLQRPPPRPLLDCRAMFTTRRAAASMSGSRARSHGPGAAGKWTDAATGEHGDLIDLIASNCGLPSFRDACREARSFLSLPPRFPERSMTPAPRNSPEAARRLFCAGVPIVGTPAEAYLRARGITGRLDWPSLRFHAGALVQARCRCAAPVMAGPARRRHRYERSHHRRAPHVSRSRASRQGAASRSAPGARPSARQWRAVHGCCRTCRDRCAARRRRHRDRAVAQDPCCRPCP